MGMAILKTYNICKCDKLPQIVSLLKEFDALAFLTQGTAKISEEQLPSVMRIFLAS